MDKELADKVKKRRTFAIISHPDAGKTTITEQMLLFGGVIRKAGTVGFLLLVRLCSLNIKANVSIFWIRQDTRTSQKILTVH